MKIATWNVNSLAVRLPQVLDWLATTLVDLSDDKFPLDALASVGYQSAVFGQKTYNGVAILSRTPARNIVKNIVGFTDEQSRVIAATLDTPQGELRLVNGYFVNGQAPGSDKFAYKMRWLESLRNWLQSELAAHPNLVLVGDFNITTDDRDTYDAEGLRETIHHTTEERDHLKALLGLGLIDAFRLFEQPDKSYSWWDYREFAFRRNRGLRIDYILVSNTLKPAVQSCVIDKLPRKNERPSDQKPILFKVGAPPGREAQSTLQPSLWHGAGHYRLRG